MSALSELRELVERFGADRAALSRRYDLEDSPARRERLRRFYQEWIGGLDAVEFEALGLEGRLDVHLLRNHLGWELRRLKREEKLQEEIAPLLPFAPAITGLHEARRRMETPDPAAAAAALSAAAASVDDVRRTVENVPPIRAARAAAAIDRLLAALEKWHCFYAGYDPLMTWWIADPYRRAGEALKGYAQALRERAGTVGAEALVTGDPIGAEGLEADLEFERIATTPDELIALAEREWAWCEAEMRRAAGEMGFADDWRPALENVKGLHVEPGRQPELVRDLALEAIRFVEERDLVTVPPLAKEVWRMEMMSPEAQRINPFFLGGEVIRVSFPTDGMAHPDKWMSLRGNNEHFARATVQHELIPGHHLQSFMMERHHRHRGVFWTPFWIEGWTLHWEMLLWDLGFPRGPEDRVGMLFWRMHRAARVLFSLRFHLGEMTPQEAVELLVAQVGHERANAEAEVRRSFDGSYPPLYQAAYLLGGLQVRALYGELVHSGRMSPREFHDAFLEGGPMPVAVVRARLLGLPLSRESIPVWRFDRAG